MKKFNHKQLQSLLLRIKKKHKFKCIQLIDKKITNRHLVLKVKINDMFYAIKFLLNSKDVNYFHFRFNLKNYLLLKNIFKNLIFFPKIIGHGKDDYFKFYIILDWVDGTSFSLFLKKNKFDLKNKMIKILFRQINNLHKINSRTSQKVPRLNLDQLKKSLILKIKNPIFKKLFKKNINPLLDFIKNYKFKKSKKSLIIYDLHPDNIIISNKKIYFIDFDYIHFGFKEVEFVSIFLDIVARYSSNKSRDISLLRKQFFGFKTHTYLPNEKFFVFNHYVSAILKHYFKREKYAKSKIPIYIVEINNIITNNKINYPRIVW